MGNRAVITFDQQPTEDSLGIYLHWNGGAESVLAFLECANKFSVRVNESYELARLVQIIGNFFGGTLSLGLGRLAELDCDNGDNGVFIVSRAKVEPEIWQIRSGLLESKRILLSNAEIRKHAYWQPGKDDGKTLLDSVIEANTDKFNGKP